MKWVLLVIVLLVIFVFFRRVNRETRVESWQGRAQVPFETFYAQNYANSGLEKEAVRMALHMIARVTDIPADRLQATDRIDELKPGAFKGVVSILQRIDATSIAERAGIPHPQGWNTDTVDAVIRLFAPYYEHMKVTAE